jgi:diguanylate cyclase (GGDEF)-like protein
MIAEDAGIEKERLCRPIRSTEWGKTVYIIVLLHDYENEQVALALTAGADTCVPKAFDARALDAHLQVVQRFVDLQAKWASDRAELHRIARELALSHRRLEVLSLTDQLTGLGNRRSAIDALDRAWRQSERAGMPMSVIMLDIDHFKRVNDQFGHAAGDQVLADVAGALQKATRQGEGTYRMGGEEFLLLSTAPEIKQLVVIAERLRRRIAGLHIAYGEHVIQVTTSLGLAVREPEHEHVDALLSAADQALYAAKAGGRNCFYFNHNNRIRTIKATATG